MSPAAFRSLVAIVLILCVRAVFAQSNSATLPGTTLEITGQVRLDRESRTRIENSLVRLESDGGVLVDQTAVDSRGRFQFSRVKPGQYRVSLRISGFKESTQQVTVGPFSQRPYVFLDLTPDASAPATAAGMVDARVPAEAQKEFEKGRAALADKDSKRAFAHLEKAVHLYPDFFDAHLLLGAAYRDAQQWDKAERTLRRVLELRPKTAIALVELGEVYRRQKRYAEAERVLRESIEADDNSWQSHFTLGRVYWEMGDPVKAASPAGRAIQLKPDYPEARLLGANILMRVGKPQNALVEYEEYLRLAPKGEFAEQTRGIVQKLRQALAEKK